MRVTCPNCLTDYDVPDDAIAGRPRMVRCAHCGHQWRHGAAPDDTPEVDDTEASPAPGAAPLIDAPPLPPAEATTISAAPERVAPPVPAAPEPAAPMPAAPEPAFIRPRAKPQLPPPPPPRRRAPAPGIIALLILALVIVVLAAHRPIMRVWPGSAGFYQALGLD